MSRIHLTGYILDAWEAEDRSIFIAFKPTEPKDGVMSELIYYQNTHTQITLKIGDDPPVKITDLMGKEPDKVD